MGEVAKIDTFAPAQPGPKDVPAESVAAMSAQARTGVTRASVAEPVKDERPAWLPENYKTVEDFVKSNKELQAELTRVKQGIKAPETKPTDKPADKPADAKPSLDGLKLGEKPTEKPVEGAPKTAEEAVEKAGLDMEALSKEYQQSRKLSPESMAALKKVGISEEIVNGYIAGQEAIAEKIHADLHSVAGGKAQFDAMRDWAIENLSQPDRLALNKTIETGNHEAIKMAFAGIHAKWTAAGHDEPTGQITGNKAGAGNSDRYTHRDEILKDMNNPEYKTNEAYRQNVLKKIKRSNVW